MSEVRVPTYLLTITWTTAKQTFVGLCVHTAEPQAGIWRFNDCP